MCVFLSTHRECDGSVRRTQVKLCNPDDLPAHCTLPLKVTSHDLYPANTNWVCAPKMTVFVH